MEKQPNGSIFPSVRPYILIITKRQTSHQIKINDDFKYVVQRTGKEKICFGSCQERSKCGDVSRFGVEFIPHVYPDLWPGKYYVSSSLIQKRPESVKGTAIGGRTATTQLPMPNVDYPTPATYTIPDLTKTATTISSRSHRFPTDTRKQSVVGPGYYNLSLKLQRTPKFQHSFGGRRRLVPAIEMKCGPFNYDTCEKCKEAPIGDYWYLTELVPINDRGYDIRTINICRGCYKNEKINPSTFTKAQLSNFKKTRDCSQVHFHDGCEARLLLVPPRDIEKIQEKEAYLSLFFS